MRARARKRGAASGSPCRWRLAAALGLSLSAVFTLGASGGDILRGGSAGASRRDGATAGANRPPGLEAINANARDALARTTEALRNLQGVQEAARRAAQVSGRGLTHPNQPGVRLPPVPNGLTPGGLVPAAGAATDPNVWRGARLPTQFRNGAKTVVQVEQTKSQAVLTWENFNIGKGTRLQINQAAGGPEKSSWVAFNKVNDPSGRPSQILGEITAPGQVYIINRNGIIFGGSSQVQTRTTVASSLPINDNLIRQGLLNNRDVQFLFSGLTVPGGADGTPIFNPEPPPTQTGKYGDVLVQPGAQLTSVTSGDGNGGRVMLVGPNVENAGTISTPAGQTILAAGLQVAVAAHNADDPSLRGLDTFVGAVGDYGGRAINRGLISAPTGSVTITGKNLQQLGGIESTTSVDLNGRIDLLANYGAVANPNFDNVGLGGGGPQFLYQNTGTIRFGPGSVTQILPDYASEAAVPGVKLSQPSQINLQGLSIHLGKGALMLAPNASVGMRAGTWAYRDGNGDRTIFGANGAVEPLLADQFSGRTQNFLFGSGQIYLDELSLLNVAGSTEVFVPLAHSILAVEFRGNELADSPLQRGGRLRAVPLTVDLRRSGTYNGRFWIGTALGDATGLAGIVERNVAQLTATGGQVSLQSGGSIVVRDGATVDVSGGSLQHEAGLVQTTRLLLDGLRLVDIANAVPDQRYDGIFTGQYTQSFERWGVTETFNVPWMTGARFEPAYAQGAAGGAISLKAPSMALDGELRGLTVQDPRGRATPPDYSTLALSFEGQRTVELLNRLRFLPSSPTPPLVTFAPVVAPGPVPEFTLVKEAPLALPASRLARVTLSTNLLEEQGFGHLSVTNPDGDIVLPEGTKLRAPTGGSITLAGANVALRSDVSAPSGRLAFTATTISPNVTASFSTLNPTGALAPRPSETRGRFTLSSGATLDAAGVIVDDRPQSRHLLDERLEIEGGSISIDAYDATLARGTTLDVSGGVAMSTRGAATYGAGGAISIRTGKDPGFTTVTGGELLLGSTLKGYSGGTGGSLTLRASMIQIGGTAAFPNTLRLAPEFFRTGGFTSYALEGIGAATGRPVPAGAPADFAPAILIAPGTRIAPVAESWLATNGVEGELTLQPMLRERGQRAPVSLTFSGSGVDDLFTTNRLEIRSDLVLGPGAQIVTDPGASVTFRGQTVSIGGSISAPGGAITIAGANEFPFAPDDLPNVTAARTTVYVSPQSVLSTAGTSFLVPDAFGRRLGSLLAGGTITISGNIVAENGSVLDVSGSAATFDLHPAALQDGGTVTVPTNSGLTDALWRLRTVPTRVESPAGTIDLEGGQMLFTDATLLGRAGGPTVLGGTLSVFSGRFYPQLAAQRSADINLVVTQAGRTIAATNRELGVGQTVLGANGAVLPGLGYFTADRFHAGGFESLDLGYKFLDASPLSFGGNVEFRGPVSIQAPGKLRVAAGGIIQADATVSLTGSYLAIGQAFRPPIHPDEQIALFTQVDPANPSPVFSPVPTFGSGRLQVQAGLIDIGTLSLQNIGRASFDAGNGDIRGNGTLTIAGDLTLRAGQIYPTTLSQFNLFAYDRGNTPGSVTFLGTDARTAPWSAGGALNVYASRIHQGGVLRAPFGTITLGWDGTDLDPSDADLDAPINPVLGATPSIPVPATPTARNVTLQGGSITSVAGYTGTSGIEMTLPFGLSPDGNSWIDPRGMNITLNGIPAKAVTIAGDRVQFRSGATIDLRGGGDLFAVRFVPGTNGSIDLLGQPSAAWNEGRIYQAGDLVSFGGQTWSARVRHTGETPTVGAFWSQVAESYAIVPGFNSEFAPYAAFNTSSLAPLLDGDPGFVSGSLKVGDRLFLNATEGLPAGNYTLLPRRYAVLPGAFLVTPTATPTLGTVPLPTGATFVSGFEFNHFARPDAVSPLRARYEVAPFDVVQARAGYQLYFGNEFFTEAAIRNDLAQVQRLPIDSGYLSLNGNLALRANGWVETLRPPGGRGAEIDLSSFADIFLVGKGNAAPAGSTVVLNTDLITRWGAESVVVGAKRFRTGNDVTLQVRTDNLVLDNSTGRLAAPDVTLAAKEKLTVTAGSSLLTRGQLAQEAPTFRVVGDGVLLRTSLDPGAQTVRTGTTGATTALLTIGADAKLAGASLTIDSSYGTAIDPTARFTADTLSLGSGQISVLLAPTPGGLTGSVVPDHLVISGELLRDVQKVDALTLRSYRTIDFYGAGDFGGGVGTLKLLGGGLRGFDQGGGGATITAGSVLFSNPSNVAALAAPAVTSGTLTVNGTTLRLGDNAFSVLGYDNVALNGGGSTVAVGNGSFTTPANLTITTPAITASGAWKYGITSGQALVLTPGAGGRGKAVGALGARLSFTGASVVADTAIRLPSGEISLRALTGDLTVGGELNAAGRSFDFYGVTRSTPGGDLLLTADQGNVSLSPDALITVAGAATGGAAGVLKISVPKGTFALNGASFLGTAADGFTSGTFSVDAGTIPSFTDLAGVLNEGGFFERRDFRVRVGDLVIANPTGGTNIARIFNAAADDGRVVVTGTIDASGETGGSIVLSARRDVVLESTAKLTAHGKRFRASGGGGEIRLEAGSAIDGVADTAARVDLQAGAEIDLGVDALVAGDYKTAGSSAFNGQFTGKLHLRAPRIGGNTGVGVNEIRSTITGASSIVVEGFEVMDLTGTGGQITGFRTSFNAAASTISGATTQGQVFQSANTFMANHAAMQTTLLGADSQGLASALVIAPGVEIINRTGDLTLGTATSTAIGTSANGGDWNLSDFRFGPKQAPGVLTLKAAGSVVMLNALSDGFRADAAGTPGGLFLPAAAGGPSGAGVALWLSPLQRLNEALPVNTQSWSFRISAGADLAAADFRSVQSLAQLESLFPSSNPANVYRGSLQLGKFYAASLVSGSAATTTTAINNRYQVIRTGTGDIDIATGRDVQLRNQFASIYTAGVRLPDRTTVFAAGDFTVPIVDREPAPSTHPNQDSLGAPQQRFAATWSMAGGDVTLSAQRNIERVTLLNGLVVADSTRQLPNNWFYRRGFVGTDGLFAVGGVDTSLSGGGPAAVTDASASTAWWVDFSSFFQSVGALGGGNVSLLAGNNISNTDAVIPTNARMPGLDPLTGARIAPDASKLVELGGGDLVVRAGNDLDAGVYYVQRGEGTLFAGGEIKTNATRSPSLGLLSSTPAYLDAQTWLPTTLFLGHAQIDVGARGNVLIGPATNPFLLPQGNNNKFWYKTYFHTMDPEAEVNVASYGGGVTHRLAVTAPTGVTSARPILDAWLATQQVLQDSNAANFQPWLRLAETRVNDFTTQAAVSVPRLTSTAFAGDVNLVGGLTLFPSPTGTLELLASGGIIGLNPTGISVNAVTGRTVNVWTAATVNVSDSDPASLPSAITPLAYNSLAGRFVSDIRQSSVNPFTSVNLRYLETGSFTGAAGDFVIKQALHDQSLLHRGDDQPIRLSAGRGDITGLTLFAPKFTQIHAGRDLSDVSIYIQHVDDADISVISAGRDIVPFNENAALRSTANDLAANNFVGDGLKSTTTGAQTKVLPGDLQISGPGVLEVLAGRNFDLGTGANFTDGTGVGLTSIGNFRNPFLPFAGADLIALAGVSGPGGRGAATSLLGSSLDFAGFIAEAVEGKKIESTFLANRNAAGGFEELTPGQQAIVALEVFYQKLRESGRTGDFSIGETAIASLYGTTSGQGEIFTRARDIRTSTGGSISLGAPSGGVTMASDIFGNPLTPPGIVTEFGGPVSIFTQNDVDIGQARIFTLRGGDLMIWSSVGNIAAGTAPKTVVTAPPTRVAIDAFSADVKTDLGGLATGGGIGVLAAVKSVLPGDVDLIAPQGFVDAGDAGIRTTGNLNIAAVTVLNASNIQVGGSSTGVPAAPAVAAPNIAGATAGNAAAAAQNATANEVRNQAPPPAPVDETPSAIVVEVLTAEDIPPPSSSTSRPQATPEPVPRRSSAPVPTVEPDAPLPQPTPPEAPAPNPPAPTPAAEAPPAPAAEAAKVPAAQ